MLISSYIISWWYLSKIETSTPCLEITFWLIQKIRSIQDMEPFMAWMVLSIICVYPADDVRESSSRPAE